MHTASHKKTCTRKASESDTKKKERFLPHLADTAACCLTFENLQCQNTFVKG